MVRNSFTSISADNFKRLYITYIRPHLEFASTAWSPYLRKDIDLLEGVQRRATRLSKQLAVHPYAERLAILGLTTLEERRRRADLIEAYRILNHLNDDVLADILTLNTHNDLRGHKHKLFLQRAQSRVRSTF